MATFIALLRGVNVGGHKRVPMVSLRETLHRAGYTNVVTYIQSGNVVFDADENGPDALAKSIEAALTSKFGFDVPVIVRTCDELAAAASVNPYVGVVDDAQIGIALLKRVPTIDDPIDPAVHRPDEFTLVGREVHLHCPNGFGRTKLTNAYLEDALGVVATTRNVRTVRKLLELSDRRKSAE